MTGSATPLQAEDPHRTELNQRLAKLDQNISSHSALRDSYARRSSVLSFTLVVSSTIVAVLAVASDPIKSIVLPDWVEADLLISICGVIVLLGTISELSFGWREKGAAHAEAARSLARLKLLITHELSELAPIPKPRFAELRQSYEDLHDLIAKIPERKFLKMKAAHQRKVEMSRFISAHPGASVWLLRARLWLRDNTASIRPERERTL